MNSFTDYYTSFILIILFDLLSMSLSFRYSIVEINQNTLLIISNSTLEHEVCI